MLKYCCNFIFLVAFSFAIISPCWANGRHLVLITHWQQEERAQLVKEHLIRDIGIPESAIDLIAQFRPCQRVYEALYYFCIVEGEETFKVIMAQQDFFQESFGHLLAKNPQSGEEKP